MKEDLFGSYSIRITEPGTQSNLLAELIVRDRLRARVPQKRATIRPVLDRPARL